MRRSKHRIRSPRHGATDRLPVLTWHVLGGDHPVLSTPLERFRRQLDLLAEHGFRGLGLGQALEHLDENGAFPPKAVVLTFDDGYRDLHRQGLRELADRGFGATVFLLPGLLDLPPEQGHGAEAHSGIHAPLMSWDEAAECRAGGLELGAHGLDHPDFTRLGDAALEAQLGEARRRIEDRLGGSVQALAYPYGRHDARVRRAAGRHYRLACTTRPGRWRADADLLAINRVDAYYLRSDSRFLALLDGRLEVWLRARRALRRMKRLVSPDESAGYQYD